MVKIIWKELKEDDPIFKTGFIISNPKPNFNKRAASLKLLRYYYVNKHPTVEKRANSKTNRSTIQFIPSEFIQ